MDLGAIFRIGQNFQDWLPWIVSPYNGSGRYFPFYWIYNSFQVYLFGTNVAPFFFVQSIVFVATGLLISAMLQKVTNSRQFATLLLILFYFSTPIPENLNTLGKAEPLASLLMVCIILSFCNVNVVKMHVSAKKNTLTNAVLVCTLFPLAIWTKETSIALFGFGATGFVVSIFLGKLSRLGTYSGALAKDYLYLLLLLFVGLCISKAPYIIFPEEIKTSNYTDYSITLKLIIDNATFYVFQQPDVIIFGLMAIILLAIVGKRMFFNVEAADQFQARGYIFMLSLCSMAWAYYLVLLVWRWPMAYYMLLPAIVFKLCAIYGLYITGKYGLVKKMWRNVMYGFIALSTLYAAFYTYYIASSQIAYSRIYTDAMYQSDHYMHLPGEKHFLIMESYPFYAEQTSLQLDTGTGWRTEGAKGIADVLDPDVTSNKELLELLHVTQAQIDENVNNLPKRGDYLLVITGSKLATWFSRGVTPYYTKDSILKTQGMYNMELLAERSIETPALYIHVWTHNLAAEKTYIGYKLYRVLEDEPKFLWRGRYPDGWIGRRASLKVNNSYDRRVVIKLSAPSFALPNKVTISKDGNLFKVLELTDTSEKVLTLSDIPQESTSFQFEVQRAIVPKNIKLNKDARELGLRITLDTD
ncbi:MAG: hypothetical protein K0M58_04090 [Thiobacillus sp.]|nr:hypothetical protein [Thiobacillus sp.]